MVKTYSVKKDGSTKLTENFTVKEFACKDGSDEVLIDSELAGLLQKIRNHFGKAVTINSAYRNAAYNKKIGGVTNSQHTKGTAADICISGVAQLTIAQYAEYLMPKRGGIGLYPTFVHVDVRSARSRWKNYGSEVVVSGFAGYSEKSEAKTAADAIALLVNAGVINTPDIWYNGTWTDDNFKSLLIKLAAKIGGKTVSTSADAIAALVKAGIINTPDIWYKGTWTDDNFKSLLIKAANAV